MGVSRFVPGGKIAGKYTLVCELGSGGMSDIWLARNDATDAEVVLKVARGCDAPEDDSLVLRERFRNEARACATLGHRNIVRVFDLIEEDGASPLLVMELLRGSTLSDCLAMNGRIAPVPAVAIMLGVLAGLEHAHRVGLIHRDIKPENVFLDVDPDGVVTPKLLDFGVAKFPRGNDNLTRNGLILGTPQYMSPEQVRARTLDARSDLFGLGTVLYEILTGASPFEAETTSASLAAVIERAPAPIDFIPPALWEILARTLDKNPANRPTSAAALAKELRDAIGLADAELASALRDLVPPPLPDSRNSLGSSRVVLRPAGASVAPRAALASQETLGGETALTSVPTVTGMRPSRRFYSLVAPIAIAVGVVAVMTFATRDGSSSEHAAAATPVNSALFVEQASLLDSGADAPPAPPERSAVEATTASAPLKESLPSAAVTAPRRARRGVALTPGF